MTNPAFSKETKEANNMNTKKLNIYKVNKGILNELYERTQKDNELTAEWAFSFDDPEREEKALELAQKERDVIDSILHELNKQSEVLPWLLRKALELVGVVNILGWFKILKELGIEAVEE